MGGEGKGREEGEVKEGRGRDFPLSEILNTSLANTCQTHHVTLTFEVSALIGLVTLTF